MALWFVTSGGLRLEGVAENGLGGRTRGRGFRRACLLAGRRRILRFFRFGGLLGGLAVGGRIGNRRWEQRLLDVEVEGSSIYGNGHPVRRSAQVAPFGRNPFLGGDHP